MTPPIELPKAETLYAVFFAPWFDAADARRPRLRSDLERIELSTGVHLRTISPLKPEERSRAATLLENITHAALSDLPALLGVSGEPGTDWLDALQARATPGQIQSWLRSSNPEDPRNNFLLLACETGALIAQVLRAMHPPLRWIEDLPYFESSLFDLNRKVMLPVFHWGIKAFSGNARVSLSEKIETTLKFLRKA